MSRPRFTRFPVLAALGVSLSLFLAGCSNSSTTSAQFAASATPAAPGLVKLIERSRSGSTVVVDVVIFGPEPALDLLAFQFGIEIGDASVVRLVPQATYTQTALVAGDGQTISTDVDSVTDPSLVQIEVAKDGGGAGNGFAAASAVVIELTFEIQGSGSTTLTLVGLGQNPPRALDSTRTPIAAVTFDAASAGVTSVTSGGGIY